MMQRKFLLLALALLLISTGWVVAQSSTNYGLQRFVMLSGGSADSANYKVTSVWGQPATGVVDGTNYKVSAGFLYPNSSFKVWLPLVVR